MSQFFLSQHFKKQIKPYLKKYRTLLDDLVGVLKNFDKTQAVALGSNTYKIRLSTQGLPKGKSHSFRVIVLLVRLDKLIAPLVIYFKGDRQSISKEEIMYHAEIVLSEIESE